MDYPDFINNFPAAKIAFDGAEASLLTSPEGQAAFFKLKEGIVIPPHSHCEQWGIVVAGKLELTISGETKVYQPGDSYHIGDGEVHSGRCLTDLLAIDVFPDPERYTAG